MGHFFPYRRTRPPAAFTLVEALVSITIASLAASVLLLGSTSSLRSTTEALQQTVAAGMARQLMDEVVGGRYAALGSGGHQIWLGPSSYEEQGSGRERYDDIDDYHGFQSSPPEDPWGIEIGKDDGEGGERHPGFQAPAGFFDHWREEIEVYYVAESDLTARLPAGQVSDYRAVEVRIIYDDPDRGRRELASLRRDVAYVPPL